MGFSGALGKLGKTPPGTKHIVPSSRARPESQGTQPGGSEFAEDPLASADPWLVQDSKGRVRSLGSIERAAPRALGSAPSATNTSMNFPGHAHVSIESSDEEDNGPEPDLEEIEWAIRQLPDSEVAHVRAALANVPWLGKRWRPKSRYDADRSDRSVGNFGSLDFLKGPP